ncbi:MAG: nodulation protein NfeD [Chloroflexi bacterium]|nr:nodulation protein NfeD [Chloroflexota bacterium]
MPRLLRLLVLAMLLVAAVSFGAQAKSGPRIDVLTIKGPISPVPADYIKRGIADAEKDGAVALIIQLDTPGGLDTSMRDIVQSIVSARVPVVVYVSPSGARAASAGVFITMAGHVAAMAPNTTIGAAHPVTSTGGELPPTMAEKIVNDAAAYIRSIAGAHGRNMEWAEKAVRESVSATEKEALELHVVDLVATDLKELVAQLDGRKVTMLGGQIITLKTQGVFSEEQPMTTAEQFLYIIADPNVAYLLLGLAIIGIITEVTHPGLIFPGVIGAIAVLLALYALGTLPVNWTGLLLILLAFGLFIAEVFTPGFGMLLVGGLISLVIGSLILFKGGPVFQINPWLIIITALIIAGFLAFVINRVINAQRRQPYTGSEELIGKTAVVREILNPKGSVFILGERWDAISDSGTIPAGEEVVITRTEGLKLYVRKKE